MKILKISTMPHDKEGRINRLLHQIKIMIYTYIRQKSQIKPRKQLLFGIKRDSYRLYSANKVLFKV